MPVEVTRLDWNDAPVTFLVPTEEEWRHDPTLYHRCVYRLIAALISHAIEEAKDGDRLAREFLAEARTWVSPRAAKYLAHLMPTVDLRKPAPPEPVGLTVWKPTPPFPLSPAGRPRSEESLSVLRTLETCEPVRLERRGRRVKSMRGNLQRLARRHALVAHCHQDGPAHVWAWVTKPSDPRAQV